MRGRHHGNVQRLSRLLCRVRDVELRVRVDNLDAVPLQERHDNALVRKTDVLVVADGRGNRIDAQDVIVFFLRRLVPVRRNRHHDDMVMQLRKDSAQLHHHRHDAALRR